MDDYGLNHMGGGLASMSGESTSQKQGPILQRLGNVMEVLGTTQANLDLLREKLLPAMALSAPPSIGGSAIIGGTTQISTPESDLENIINQAYARISQINRELSELRNQVRL